VSSVIEAWTLLLTEYCRLQQDACNFTLNIASHLGHLDNTLIVRYCLGGSGALGFAQVFLDIV
jgi:hypothetical protein